VSQSCDPEPLNHRGSITTSGLGSTCNRLLVRNFSLNPALHITPLNVALGSTPQIVEITAVPGSGINQVASVADRQGDPRQTVFQLSLDQLCLHQLAHGFQKIVVKIDVERYEFDVLVGMQHFLWSDIPIAVCIEIEPDQYSRLRSLLGSCYRPFTATCRQTRITVSREYDPKNIFFVNDHWHGFGSDCSAK
jgi:FkbM family methyltransferase